MSYAGTGLGYRHAMAGLLGGFGQVAIEREVPYKDEVTGAEGVAIASTGPNCGDPYAVQVMLYWLGFYEGPIQGQMDQKTRGALAAYALSRGIPYSPSSTPSGVLCAALIADHETYWQTQQLSPPATIGGGCAPGQWGFPPFCMGTATPERPPAADKCPEGMVGMPPYCVSLPTSVPQPASGSCPPGTVGYPPHCYGMPQGLPTIPPATLPTQPPVEKLPPPPTGGGSVPPTTTPGLPPGKPPSWWDARSDGEKTAIIGGGLVATIVIALSIKNK